MAEAGSLPLAGITVADFGQGIAGPYCAMLLAEHGADVVKIEPPRGDWARGIGTSAFEGHTAASVAMNRNKRSLTLDLGTGEGVAVARDLVARSRVVVENFRPDVMSRMGLDFDACAAGRDDLVYCSVNGFGPSGPYAALPAGDSITQPLAGLMSIIGGPDDPPMRVGNVVSDMLAGMNAFQGVLLGLMQSDRTRSCQRINVSLLASLLAFQAPVFTEYLMTGELPRRNGNDHPMVAPSGAWRTRDGWVYFTVLDHRWRDFCTGVGCAALPDDPRFVDNGARIRHRAELSQRLAPVFETRTTDECLALLREVDVPSSRINDYADVLRDPQVRHNAVFDRVEHAALGTLPVVRSPVRLDGEPVPYRHPPVNGQDSIDVLQRVLGYSPERIDALLRAGAVQGASPG